MLPILETQRLRLRPLNENDGDNIYELSKNPKVMRYLRNGQPLNRTEAEGDLQRRLRENDRLAEKKLGYWAIEWKPMHNFVGWLSIKYLDQTEEIEIGYRILEKFWGQGVTTEASRRALQYAFEELKLERIVAVALPENKASWRVMEKLGMRYEKNDHFYDNDCVYYSLQQRDWQAMKAQY